MCGDCRRWEEGKKEDLEKKIGRPRAKAVLSSGGGDLHFGDWSTFLSGCRQDER